MSNAANIKALLRPMGVYKLEDSYLGAELECVGAAIDRMEAELERVQREMCLITARAEGLEQMASLFTGRPAARQPEQLAQALAALTRIGENSFTRAALNDTLSGCGLNAMVRETEQVNTVDVRFPDVPGVPDGFERIRVLVEDILPAHLQVRYLFWYQSWKQLEDRQMTWQELQQMKWNDLETMVE